MGRGCGSGLESVANWESEVLEEGGRFLFRALLLRCDCNKSTGVHGSIVVHASGKDDCLTINVMYE